MTLNFDLVGKSLEKVPYSYDRDAIIQYALGIGIGTDGDDLDYIYEKNLKVFPTFATVPFIRVFMAKFLPLARIDLFSLLHGEHRIIIYNTIPVEGMVYSTLVWEAVYDKGDKGAVLQVKCFTRDAEGGLLFENQALFFDRSAGHFSGDRGPATQWANPPEGIGPSFRVALDTSPHQAALFRLSGDRNPLHIDPDFAKQAGYDRPILHGLCSLGIACRAVVQSLCDNDPARLKSIGARFVNVVYPGDTLVTEGWENSPSGNHLIRTTNQNDDVILGNGRAEILPP